MRGNPAADMHANSGDFASRGPHARSARVAPCFYPELSQRIDQRLLEGANVRHHVALPFSQIDDGVADDLTGTMIGYVAAAVGVLEIDPGPRERFRRGQQIFVAAVAAPRDHVRMLYDHDLIGNLGAPAPAY